METWPLLGRDDLLRQVVHHLEADGGVVLAGLPWVGRTRLLRESLARVDAETVLCRPTRSGQGIPFSGLGQLAPRDPTAPATWVADLIRNLPAPDAILAIDGAQFLDQHSALLLLQAVEAGALRVALSVWRSHPAPDAVMSLWTDGLLPRLEVEPLDRDASDELVRRAVGGPVEEATLLRLWDTCRGYPLLLREYVDGSRRAGRLVERDGLWAVVGRPVLSPALVDTARQVRAGLSPEAVEAVELLAVAEPVPPVVADRLVPPEVLEMLERWDLLVLDQELGRYRSPAPGWAEAVRAGLTSVALRRVAARLAGASPPVAELTGSDLVRVVGWHREAGGWVEPTQLVRAAEAARSLGMIPEAGALATDALPEEPLRARIVLADTHARTGQLDRAVRLLVEVAEITPDHRIAAEATVSAARLEFFRGGRGGAAIQMLEEGLTHTDRPEARTLVHAELGLLHGLLGDVATAYDMAAPVASDEDADPRARFAACQAAAVAAAYAGRLAEARRLVAVGRGLAGSNGPTAAVTLEFCVPVIELYSGRPGVAADHAERAYRRALVRDMTGAAAVWATQSAHVHALVGNEQVATRRVAEAVRLAERDDEYSVLSFACGVGALAAAHAGDPAAARTWLSRLESARPPGFARTRMLRDESTVAVLAAEGDLEGAARLAVRNADVAAAQGQLVLAGRLYHDAVRCGYGELAIGGLARIVPGVDGELAPLQHGHAEALVGGDAGLLERVAERFGSLGFTLWGAEAFAHAAELHARAGSAGRAALMRARASAMAEGVRDARTTALRGVGTETLTRREREVAVLAAEGRTSPEIADQLVVSVRTVDNHLSSVYRKLGIAGRHELAYVMAGT